MKQLEDILKEWESDSKIDTSKLGVESARVPALHAKYVDLYARSKLNSRNSYNKCINVKKKLTRYYKGLMTKEELETEGWKQYQGKVPLKTELSELIESNSLYLSMENELHYRETIQETLESIMKSIHSRTWDIKNNIEYVKFINGN